MSRLRSTLSIGVLEEHTFQLYQLGEYEKLYDLLMNLDAFSTYYKTHPYELGNYWRLLIEKGYSIIGYLEIGTESETETLLVNFYNNLARFSSELLANHKSALRFAEKSLEIKERTFGKEHPDMATLYNNIGIVYSNLGNYDKAMEYYKLALDIREKVLGKEHLETSGSYMNIGTIFFNYGDYSRSLEFFQKALTIREKVLGYEHPDTVVIYINIGNVYQDLGDYSKALEYYQKFLDIQERTLSLDYNNTIF